MKHNFLHRIKHLLVAPLLLAGLTGMSTAAQAQVDFESFNLDATGSYQPGQALQVSANYRNIGKSGGQKIRAVLFIDLLDKTGVVTQTQTIIKEQDFATFPAGAVRTLRASYTPTVAGVYIVRTTINTAGTAGFQYTTEANLDNNYTSKEINVGVPPLPEAKIIQPGASASVPRNLVVLEASASGVTPLTYLWQNEAGVELGKGRVIEPKLFEGANTVKLFVTDGMGRRSDVATRSFNVTAPVAPAPVVREAEKLTVLTKSTGDVHRTFQEAAASAGASAILDANAANDFVTYSVNVPQARNYTVVVRVKKFTSRGKFQLAIAGQDASSKFVNHGPVQDAYTAAAAGSYVDLAIADVKFASSGTKRFRFTVTGKNASSTGFTLAVDAIKLVPVVDETSAAVASRAAGASAEEEVTPVAVTNEVAAYPSPFTDRLSFAVGGKAVAQVAYYDALGKLVGKVGAQELEVNGAEVALPAAKLSQLTPGVYHFVLTFTDGSTGKQTAQK